MHSRDESISVWDGPLVYLSVTLRVKGRGTDYWTQSVPTYSPFVINLSLRAHSLSFISLFCWRNGRYGVGTLSFPPIVFPLRNFFLSCVRTVRGIHWFVNVKGIPFTRKTAPHSGAVRWKYRQLTSQRLEHLRASFACVAWMVGWSKDQIKIWSSAWIEENHYVFLFLWHFHLNWHLWYMLQKQ